MIICRYIGNLIAVFLVFLLFPSYGGADVNSNPVSGISVSFNGKFLEYQEEKPGERISANGDYVCTYNIGHIGDEIRERLNFKLVKNGTELFSMEEAPGSDFYLSNSGFVAFMDMKRHFEQELTVRIYSETGNLVFSNTYNGASLFGFSESGKRFAVGEREGLHVISLPNGTDNLYPGGDQFAFSEDDQLVVIVKRGKGRIYSDSGMLKTFTTGHFYTRGIEISKEYDIIALIDKRNLQVYSISTGKMLYSRRLKGDNSFRDILIKEGKILTGIHYRTSTVSRGMLRVFDKTDEEIFQNQGPAKDISIPGSHSVPSESNSDYDPIPWPFFPFDSIRTAWNYYEQHMGSGSSTWSYLHQGLDLITPIGEPVYAVEGGIAKCVLTISGSLHWRIAISPQQSSEWSDGWLYAHLVQSTIQFGVGDTVQMHDYLGDIVWWTQDWGHIHFVQIRDSGLVWSYNDNQWGINFNPLLALQPDTDLIPPVIDYVFPNSKFAFCTNETSNYLDADSLYGDIDIIVKVRDWIGDSPWELPAYKTYYWIKKLPEKSIIFPRTLGQVLNHKYDFYASTNYEPYATVIYKRDALLPAPSWNYEQRDYYQILTNNNGDSLISLSEKDSAFSTADYPDGDYRIYVEAFDEYGNSAIDSMDVKFRNGIVGIQRTGETLAGSYQLYQNYPNPFNPLTTIKFDMPQNASVKLLFYDALGRELNTVVNKKLAAGTYRFSWDASDYSSGIYFYKLFAVPQLNHDNRAGVQVQMRKMLLIK